MPDATITSTASTFGTITGTFAADQSTITGTVTGVVVGTLDGSVGVPGIGVPDGGTTGQVLAKASGTNYDTAWTTISLAGYATESWVTAGFYPLASNPAGYLTSASIAGLAPINSPAFTGNPTAPTAALADNDTSIATTAFVQQELASGVAIAKNLEVYVRNQTGATLTAGTIVYINGATGNRPTVTKAQANNDANSAQTFGFVKTSIANNGFGYVIVRGECENLDTQGLTEGAQLYLSPTTAGTWTTTKPSAPNHLVYVGIVVRAHPTQGVILVAIQNGYELNEIHDVLIDTPSNGQVLKYDAAQGLWINGTDSSGVAWGGITGTLSSQSDLNTALGLKYDASNPSGFITSAALSPYLTSVTAAATYQTIAGMSSYLTTSTAASTYAPLASPTFTGTVTIPAGASISGYATTASLSSYAPLASPALTGTPTSTTAAADTNTTQIATTAYVVGQGYIKSATASSTYAPLASPALTGTPTAPTATAGTNTTQIATTAFVLANAPSTSFATNAQAIVGTSTTTALSPSLIPALITRPELRSFAHITQSSVQGSGAVTAAAVAFGQREMYLSSLATGRANFSYNIPGINSVNMSRTVNGQINFSKKIWMAGKCMVGSTINSVNYNGDANTYTRITLGGYNSQTTGDMTLKGIGFKKQGGTSSYFNLTVHNGTTLTDVASTVQQSDGRTIDWQIYSDGAGNVTLYIDGVEAATTSAGPTGMGTSNATAYREQVEATTTPAVRGVIESTGGWLFIEG